MNPTEQDPPTSSTYAKVFARTARFTLVAIISGFSYRCLCAGLDIGAFEQNFMEVDRLGVLPLSAVSKFVIMARHLLVAAAILIPLAAIATLFLRRLALSFYILAALLLLTLVQGVVLYQGVMVPRMELIERIFGPDWK